MSIVTHLNERFCESCRNMAVVLLRNRPRGPFGIVAEHVEITAGADDARADAGVLSGDALQVDVEVRSLDIECRAAGGADQFPPGRIHRAVAGRGTDHQDPAVADVKPARRWR